MIENQQVEVTTTTDREAGSRGVIKKHVLISMGVGAVPIPFVDVAAVTGVQLSMISKLAKVHGVQFAEDLGKSLLAALVGGLGSKALVTSFLGSAIKAIPVVGSAIGAVTFPAFAGATTYAVGKVFDKHFEQGGTMLDFKPADVKDYFSEELDKGKKVVSNITTTVKKPFTSRRAGKDPEPDTI
jgi:uncharacterized protein (DUF697 family)